MHWFCCSFIARFVFTNPKTVKNTYFHQNFPNFKILYPSYWISIFNFSTFISNLHKNLTILKFCIRKFCIFSFRILTPKVSCHAQWFACKFRGNCHTNISPLCNFTPAQPDIFAKVTIDFRIWTVLIV